MSKQALLSTTLPDVEAVAAIVHEKAVKANQAAGKFSEKLASGEDIMVPYSQLSEAAKIGPRGEVLTVYAAIDQAAADGAKPKASGSGGSI